MFFTDLFCGMLQVNMYKDAKNRKWYDSIAEKIWGMPPRIVFPIVWTFFFIVIPLSMFFYYRDEVYPNTGYRIDTITLLFLTNTLLLKTWTFVFFSLRQTIVSMVMIVLIWLISIVMAAIFSANAVDYKDYAPIFAAVVHFLLFIWCTYAGRLNIAWLIVERENLRKDSI